MIRTQVQLTESQVRRLREHARRSGISVVEAIRRCVDQSLAGADEREPGWRRMLAVAGAFADPCTDVSEQHNELLADAFMAAEAEQAVR